MDLSTATGIFYRQALRCHGLPFEVKADETNAGAPILEKAIVMRFGRQSGARDEQ